MDMAKGAWFSSEKVLEAIETKVKGPVSRSLEVSLLISGLRWGVEYWEEGSITQRKELTSIG